MPNPSELERESCDRCRVLEAELADLRSQLATARAVGDAFKAYANGMRERVGKALVPQPREDEDGA